MQVSFSVSVPDQANVDLTLASRAGQVAIGGFALQFAAQATGRADTAAENFSVAFVVVAAISALSAWMMWKLPTHAGAVMAGRAEIGKELAEPTAAQRPAT